MVQEDADRKRRPPSAVVRARILDAALTVFARSGFSGASIDAISAEAGFTKGAVYSSFSGKDDLFFSLLQERVRDRILYVEDEETGAEPPDDAQEHARVLGTSLFELMTREPEWQLLFLEFWGRAVREPSVRNRYVAVRVELREQISTFIRRELARRGAEPAIPVEHLSTVVLALMNGLFMEEAPAPGTVPSALLGEVLSQLIRPAGGRPGSCPDAFPGPGPAADPTSGRSDRP